MDMTDWQSPKVELPPQGRKILWFKDGELLVVNRFGDKYVCISPLGGKVVTEPKLWALAPIPEPYSGFMKVRVEGSDEMLTIDELEQLDPEAYLQFVDMMQDHRFEEES